MGTRDGLCFFIVFTLYVVVIQMLSCVQLCNPTDYSTLGFSVLHHLRACSSLYPFSQWCHPTISSSVAPFSSCPQSFSASGSFPMSRRPKYWSFSFSISPSNECSELILFRIDCLDPLAVHGTVMSLFEHHSWKASVLRIRWPEYGVSASALVLPMNVQDWFPLGLTDLISLLSKGLSRVFSNTTVQKHQSLALSFLHSPTLTSIHDHWKNHSLD